MAENTLTPPTSTEVVTPVSIGMQPALVARLDTAARALGISRSQLVRGALERALDTIEEGIAHEIHAPRD